LIQSQNKQQTVCLKGSVFNKSLINYLKRKSLFHPDELDILEPKPIVLQ